ncbi:MAG: Rieske 2Fe-2S domain-containing protein [Actinobacteria bacterium]|nr:Rieske 2Fe-2S domain-containing protein [Actinomycetota bacterium]
MSSVQEFLQGVTKSWIHQSWSVRLLRLWLGITWTYAGIDKALDGGFLNPDATTYIGKQLAGFAQQSPISPLLNKMIEHATLVGAGTMVGEIAIGLATLFGVLPFLAAIAGAGLSASLWLSSSFHTTPYFLASDTAYLIMWLVFALSVMPRKRTISRVLNVDRRSAIGIGVVGALSIAFAGLGNIFAKPAKIASGAAKVVTKQGGGAPPNAIAAISDLNVGSALQIKLASGDPGILIRTATDAVCAFSAVCTHQGCTVDYDQVSKELICPCHGARFDPLQNGKAIAGPTRAALTEVPVKISGSYIISS